MRKEFQKEFKKLTKKRKLDKDANVVVVVFEPQSVKKTEPFFTFLLAYATAQEFADDVDGLDCLVIQERTIAAMYLDVGKILVGGSGRSIAVAGDRREFRARRLNNGVGVMTAPQTVAY